MLEAYIRKIPLFVHLKDVQLKEIASRCRSAHYAKGQALFHKGDDSTEMYIVSSGKLKAVLEDEEGGEVLIARFGIGDFFGEMSLLDGKGRSATIVADSDVELAVLQKDMFLELISKDPKIAVAVMATLAERLRKADEMIESLVFLEVAERLVKALQEAAGSEPAAKGFLKAGRLTHKELATRIGSSREAVSKCMKVLMIRGIVKEADGQLLIAQHALERLKGEGRS